jgi:hypothetical protein
MSQETISEIFIEKSLKYSIIIRKPNAIVVLGQLAEIIICHHFLPFLFGCHGFLDRMY